jgi:hypothetical protein
MLIRCLFSFAVAAPAALAAEAWTADPMQEITPEAVGDFSARPAPLRLVAPINGCASGQVVVKGDAAGAALSEFAGPGGAVLPTAAARLRFAAQKTPHMNRQHPYFDALEDAPQPGPVQPVWVTVKPPLATKPGKYTARLTIGPLVVPVELSVCDYEMPEPRHWSTWVDLMQSPDTLAYHYQVPLWSDRHFALLARSLDLAGQLGNRVLYATVIRDSFFGNRDSLIVFRRQDGAQIPDFTFFDRYLNLYAKHVGEPVRLVLYVWGSLPRGAKNDGASPPQLTEVDVGGRLAAFAPPAWDAPEAETFWRPVMEGVRQRVAARGWKECIIHLGCGSDRIPDPAAVRTLKNVAPYARWVFWTHGYAGAGENRSGNECVTGYVVHPDLREPKLEGLKSGVKGGWAWRPEECIKANSFRDWLTDDGPLEHWRCVAEASTGGPPTRVGGMGAGIARLGLDFWPVREPGAQSSAPILRGSGPMYRLTRGTPRAVTVPGPDGAVATVRFQMLREGVQECEARIQIEKALLADKLDPQTRKAVEDFLLAWLRTKWDVPDERRQDGRLNSRVWAVGERWQDNTARLYELAGRATRAMAATGISDRPDKSNDCSPKPERTSQ